MQPLPCSPRLLVFDLDGTLVDSAEDLACSVNAMLHQMGRSALPHALIASYIGDGASMLVRRALGDPEGEPSDAAYVEDALQRFLSHYREHKLDHTRLYAGTREALTELRRAHPQALFAVLTNKPVRPSREICEGLGIASFFFKVYGGDSFHTKKPDPTGLQALIQDAAEEVDAPIAAVLRATVMIGDSAVDVLTARACGASVIGCTFGFAPASLASAPPDALADSPADWPRLLPAATA